MNIKRLLILSSVLMLAMAMTACGKDEEKAIDTGFSEQISESVYTPEVITDETTSSSTTTAATTEKTTAVSTTVKTTTAATKSDVSLSSGSGNQLMSVRKAFEQDGKIYITGVYLKEGEQIVDDEDGEVYVGVDGEELAYSGVNVEKGTGSIVRIFHADRDSASSTFSVKFVGMNLSVTDTKLAEGNDDGVQIAYDPNDPTYVAPLGESSVFRPDSTKGLIVMATIEGVVIVVISVLVASVARLMIKRRVDK